VTSPQARVLRGATGRGKVWAMSPLAMLLILFGAAVALAVASAPCRSPDPFAMVVALVASAAFMTPASSLGNMPVVGPGNRRSSGFLQIGVPFAAIWLVASARLVPMVRAFRWLSPRTPSVLGFMLASETPAKACRKEGRFTANHGGSLPVMPVEGLVAASSEACFAGAGPASGCSSPAAVPAR